MPLLRRIYEDFNLRPLTLILTNVGVMQSFQLKVTTNRRNAIKSFKHHLGPDSKIHPKHYSFEPLLQEIPYESIGARSLRSRFLSSSMLLMCHFFIVSYECLFVIENFNLKRRVKVKREYA